MKHISKVVFKFFGYRVLGIGYSEPHTPNPIPQTLAMICCILVLFATNVFATQSRIESMGKRSSFFLDDMTMFQNPANATFYSSALMGELGFYEQNRLGPSDVGFTRDPFTPWFGALFQFGLSDMNLRDPEITIGGFFGREHYDFTRFVPKKVVVQGDTVAIPESVTNFDAFLAGTMIDGSAVGAHVYVGIQDGKRDDDSLAANAHVSILSMDYGANFLISNRSSIEVTLGAARIQYGPSRKTFLDPGLFSFYSYGRLFLEMDIWNGQFITGYRAAAMEVPGWTENMLDVNVGMNLLIPRGFVWVGLDGVHVKEEVGTWDRINEHDELGRVTDSYLIYREPGWREPIGKDTRDRIGTVLSFGVERNVFKNWILVRAGGQKSFVYEVCENKSGLQTICKFNTSNGRGKGNYWSTNPYGDGTLDDHLGFGIGLNIENKLKIDANIAEDALFRNPFQGEGRIISRISAIYSF